MSEGVSDRIRLLLPITLFLVVAGLLAVVLFETLSGDRNPEAIPSPLIGQPAPEFRLDPPAGLSAGLASADLRGQVTVLNVFASWCIPCLAEHPYLMQLGNRDDIQVAGLNYKDRDPDVVRWLSRHGNPFDRIGADRNGRVGIEWGVTGVPETFVIDARGIVRFKYTGPITPDAFRRHILPAIERARE